MPPGGDTVFANADITDFGEVLENGGVTKAVPEHLVYLFPNGMRKAGDFAGGKALGRGRFRVDWEEEWPRGGRFFDRWICGGIAECGP